MLTPSGFLPLCSLIPFMTLVALQAKPPMALLVPFGAQGFVNVGRRPFFQSYTATHPADFIIR